MSLRDKASRRPRVGIRVKPAQPREQLPIKPIDPAWEPPSPPTVPEKILAWVEALGKAVTKAEILAGVKTKYVGNTLKKVVEKSKTLSFDKTAKTCSIRA